MEFALFRGITEEEKAELFQCLKAVTKEYRRGETIYQAGTFTDRMGLVVAGKAAVESCDIWGNGSILDVVEPGEVFAETYACLENEPLMVSVTAFEDTQILFFDMGKLLRVCSPGCGYHSRLVQNLLQIMAEKNLSLSRKIFHTTPKTIRERVVSYLSDQAVRQGKNEFEIALNRQQLADYLGVDRSALSNELSKMQREGLLTFQKNRFVLKTDEML